jgi:hypothetical protein
MLRMLKWLFILGLLVFAGTAVWTAFALWSGLYSVYSYPPGKDDPDGSTLIIKRDDDEPMYNSPDYVAPKEKPREDKEGVGFGKLKFVSKKPIGPRTVFTLPYIEWAYEQSLNEKQLEAYRKKMGKVLKK